MRLSQSGELSLLEAIRRRFPGKASGLVLGIGDDAAVVRTRDRNVLLTTDMMVEGVHFDLKWTTPFQLGFKLVSVNVSDIYAMGGRPRFLLLNFAAHGNFDTRMFDRLFDGIEWAADHYGVALIGGDVSSADRVVLSATVVGESRGFITRRGAKAGDRIYVTGNLGDSAAGLLLMKKIGKQVEIEKGRRMRFGLAWEVAAPLIGKHLMPVAVDPAKFCQAATSMIDISDGLLIDLARICRDSGVGALLDREKIPVSHELASAAAYLAADPIELALGGGEDYELLFTAPKGRKVKAICIGEITRSGLRMTDEAGKTRALRVKGYQHFAA